MYATRFGLRHRPFPATPDSAGYYPATGHERALARLLQGLADGEGFLLATGAAGTGKTLLCHCLLERHGDGRPTVFLTNSHFTDRAALLQAILFDLSLPYEGRGEQEMRLALTDHLLKTHGAGQPTVLVADEAHHLTPDLLEELRLLGNLETRAGKALQVVLVGLPALLERLAGAELAALRQRLAVRVALEPLPLQEAADFVLHQLRAAGARPEEVLAADALELLARSTGGVPRLLNQVAHLAFRLAADADAGQVDVEAVLEALHFLGLEAAGAAEEDAPARPGTEETADALLPLSAEGKAAASEAADESSCRLFVTPRTA